jgi:tetratricopeptide (TPR) repeat protein
MVMVVAMAWAGCAPADAPTVSSGLREVPNGVQAIALSGDTLRTRKLLPDVQREYEANLARARAEYERDPTDTDAIIWLGRRTAYLGEYRRAIEIYTGGIGRRPSDARLYRHRGHRYITVRMFDRAQHDLEVAASLVDGRPDEVEPDGLPNERNIPTSTLQSNIWYHLGLARYLQGNFEGALEAYRECLAVSANPDMLVATSHWLYMILRRLEREEEAAVVLGPIHAGMDIIENHSYHDLLLLYKGEITPDSLMAQGEAADALQNATLAYGIGNYHYYNGRTEAALQIFRRIVEGPQWAAFGYIAAEADLARRGIQTGL